MTNSDSFNILGFFLYNFDSFGPILFIFTPTLLPSDSACLKGK